MRWRVGSLGHIESIRARLINGSCSCGLQAWETAAGRV